MPEFEFFVHLIRAQLWGMQGVPTPDDTDLDENWVREIYEYEATQPLVNRRNELVIARAWEEERKRRTQVIPT